MTTFSDYATVSRTLTARLDAIGKDRMVERDIAYFKANIGKIEAGDELINDYRLYSFAMKAFGLEDQIYAKGLMRKVFDEGIVDPKSTANQMTDEAFKEIATTFGFAEFGNINMSIQSNVDAVVSRYLRQTLEQREGEDNEGVRLALYFERKAPSIENWYEVLGDPALAEVMRTAFGLPPEFAQSNIDRQAEFFESKVPIGDLKNPQKRQALIGRFTALWDTTQGAAAGSVDLAANGIAPIQPLSSNGTQIVSIDPALLTALARYRL